MELQEVGRYSVEPFALERILELELVKKINDFSKNILTATLLFSWRGLPFLYPIIRIGENFCGSYQALT